MLGIAISMLSLVYFLVVVIQRLAFGTPVPGPAHPRLAFLSLLGGVQLLALGVMGEYVARIFLEVKQRPLYIVEEKIGELGKATPQEFTCDRALADSESPWPAKLPVECCWLSADQGNWRARRCYLTAPLCC